jgi:GT2 family glycosyltransferase
VVVPFLGDEAEGRRLLDRLAALELRAGDELIVADNTPDAVLAPLAGEAVMVIAAGERRSASHARNLGAARASNEWLLFLDADCVPPPGLLDDYFATGPGERCAILAGEIVGDPAQRGALARWARSRRGHWIAGLLADGRRPAAVTANMLVRRAAFDEVGGFEPGGGGDFDLSWRLQDGGWGLELRPRALVLHRDRETLRGVAEQARSYGSHLRHLRSRHRSGVARATLLAPLARSLGGAAVWLLRGERERARFSLVDGYYAACAWLGQLAGPPRHRDAD